MFFKPTRNLQQYIKEEKAAKRKDSKAFRRTIPHFSYLEPDRDTIYRIFRDMGYDFKDKKKIPYELILDLANYYSWHINNYGKKECYRMEVLDEIRDSNLSDENKDKMLNYTNNIFAFLRTIQWKAFAGFSPLGKAFAVVNAMQARRQTSEQDGECQGESLQKLFTQLLGENEESFDEAMKVVESEQGEGEGDQLGQAGNAAVEDEDFADGKTTNMVDIYEELEDFTQRHLKITGSVANYVAEGCNYDPEYGLGKLSDHEKESLKILGIVNSLAYLNTSVVRTKFERIKMRNFSDIANASPMSQLVLPMSDINILKRNIKVTKRYTGGKQSLIVIIDDSGSMHYTQKVQWVLAIVANRLQSVIEGDSELYITTFLNDADMANVKHIRSKKDALKLLKDRWRPQFGGGGTDIQRSIETVFSHTKRNKVGKHPFKGINPEVLIVNDGQDSVDPSFKPEFKTHCFILGTENKNLQKVVESSGGVYNYVPITH